MPAQVVNLKQRYDKLGEGGKKNETKKKDLREGGPAEYTA